MKIFMRKMFAIVMVMCLVFTTQGIQTYASEIETANETIEEAEGVENTSDVEVSKEDDAEIVESTEEEEIETKDETESEVGTSIEETSKTELDEGTIKEEIETKEVSMKEKINNDFYGSESDIDEGFTGITASDFHALTNIDSNLCLTEDTNLESDINVIDDATLCLHGSVLSVNGGKFNVSKDKTLTIKNCKEDGSVNFIQSEIVSGSGKLTLDNIIVNTETKIEINDSNFQLSKVVFNEIELNGADYFIEVNNSNFDMDRMEFNGLKAGFLFNKSKANFKGVSVYDSTADVLFTVNDNSKVNLSIYRDMAKEEFLISYYERNKNFALVDNSIFLLSGALKTDIQNDIVMTDYKGNPTRDVSRAYDPVQTDKVKLLGSEKNPINKNLLQRVVVTENKGNYIFGVKNNSKIMVDGIILKNTLTPDNNGKMGAYVNLGGQNTLVLCTNPYINQNTRNIVVTDNDYITCDTDELDYTVSGQALSINATLSFYLTEKKYQRIMAAPNSAYSTQTQGGDFADNFCSVEFDGTVKEKYFIPACMIEGYRDDIFNIYDESYAGYGMRVLYGENKDGSDEFGFFAEPYEEKEIVNITVHANGGTFKDPDGNIINDSFTFEYDTMNPNADLVNWFKNLNATCIAKEDGYESTEFLFSRLADELKSISANEILEYNSDIDVYLYFSFPQLYTLKFRAEKGGSKRLNNIGYKDFVEKTAYVRLTEKYSGKVIAPSIEMSVLSGYSLNNRWISENTSFNKYLVPGKETVFHNVVGTTVFYYYPDLSVVYNANSSSSSGGSGGGDSSSTVGPINSGLNSNLSITLTDGNIPVAGNNSIQPSNENPFAASVFVDQAGVTQVQNAAQVAEAQVQAATNAMQQAVLSAISNTGSKTEVSQVSMNANEAAWAVGQDGKWTLTSTNAANAGQVTNTWQAVKSQNGKEGWYKFDSQGKMQTGWVVDNNKVYYLIESGSNQGQMVKDVTINIGGVTFAFGADGSLSGLNGTLNVNTGSTANLNTNSNEQSNTNTNQQTSNIVNTTNNTSGNTSSLPRGTTKAIRPRILR